MLPTEPASCENLAPKLHSLERRLRRLTLLRGAGKLSLVATACVAVGLLVDFRWSLGTTTRLGLFAALLLILGYALWKQILRPALRIHGAAELAAIVEQAHPRLAERLTSSIELSEPDPAFSELMRRTLARETLSQASALDFEQTVSGRSVGRWVAAGALAVAALLCPFALSADSYRLLWSRLFIPWGNFETAGELYFDVAQGDRTVVRGSDVTFDAALRARRGPLDHPQNVRLTWSDAAQTTHSRLMAYDPASDRYRVALRGVLRSFEFHLSSAGHRSRNFSVDVVDAPELEGLHLRIEPPGYTGLPPAQLDGALGEIEAAEQSRLIFQARFNKPVARASLNWLEDSSPDAQSRPAELEFILAADGRSGELQMTADAGGVFVLQLRDVHRFQSLPESRTLVVIRDQPPELALDSYPTADGPTDKPPKVAPTDVLAVSVTATDDYGVQALELHYAGTGSQSGVLQAEAVEPGRRSLQHEFRITPADLKLGDGTTLTYRIRAADARPLPGPNEVWSEPQVVVIDAAADPLSDAAIAQEQQRFRELLQSLHQAVSQHRDQVGKLHAQAKEPAEPIEPPLQQQVPPLSNELRDVSRKLEELAQNFAESPLYSNLTDDLQQVGRERIAPATHQLTAAAQAESTDQVAALAQSHEHLHEAAEQLVGIAEEFDQLASIENDLLELNRLAHAAAGLAADARELQDLQSAANAPSSAEKSSESELAQRHHALQDQQQTLSEDLNQLLEKRPELVEAALAELRERLLGISQELTDLAGPQQLLAEDFKKDAALATAIAPAVQVASAAGAPELSTDTAEPPLLTGEPQIEADSAPPAASATAERLLSAQRELAREAAQLAFDVAQALGPDSSTAQAALKSVKLSAQSAESVLVGRFARAAELGAESASLTEDIVLDMQQVGGRDQNVSDLVQATESLADRQADLNQEFLRHTAALDVERAARLLGQKQINTATSVLAQELDDLSEQLAEPPLQQPVAARKTGSARNAAVEARGLMWYARTHLRQGESGLAAARARSAFGSLRDAARHAADAARALGERDSPIPGEVGKQVTDAAQQLADAQEQLAQSSPTSSAAPSQPDQSQESATQSAQEQAAAPSEQTGPGAPGPSPGDAAGKLEQASSSLAQAAQRMQPGRHPGSGPPGRESGHSPSDQTSQSAGDAAQSGGSGARTTVDLRRLESELKGLSSRNWGELPGTLQTRILQSAGKTPTGDYARLIQFYFEELARPRSTRDRSR